MLVWREDRGAVPDDGEGAVPRDADDDAPITGKRIPRAGAMGREAAMNPLSDAELDALLDEIEYRRDRGERFDQRVAAALRQVRKEVSIWKEVQADTLKAQFVADAEVKRLRAERDKGGV